MSKCFYEKRIITDINNNTYPIWEIYKLENGISKQLCVIHSLEEFNSFKKQVDVSYRQLTSRGRM